MMKNSKLEPAPRWLAFVLCLFRAADALKGFGLIFGIEPEVGSIGGGTELHVSGTGFADVVAIHLGGRPCRIFEPSVKDGELFCYTPPGENGERATVEAIFNSGHVAAYLHGTFHYHSKYTPHWRAASTSVPVLSNVSWFGDLKRMLAGNQQEMFETLREKRNATELQHAYLGSGLELNADKGGPGEYRCDMIWTPDQTRGVCSVGQLTPAGYYNFSYVLDPDPTSDDEETEAFGRHARYFFDRYVDRARSQVTLEGVEYEVQVFPTLHRISQPKTGRLGGARVKVYADALDPMLGNPSMRHAVSLDGVPCKPLKIERGEEHDVITCNTGPYENRTLTWPELSAQPAPGHHFRVRTSSEVQGVGLAHRMYDFPDSPHRTLDILANVELRYPLKYCVGSLQGMGTHYDLESCANFCFRVGDCRWFEFIAHQKRCNWCKDVDGGNGGDPDPSATIAEVGRRRYSTVRSDGVYRMAMTGLDYLQANNVSRPGVGNSWRLISATSKCESSSTYQIKYDLGGTSGHHHGVNIQTCADICAASVLATPGHYCKYFGIHHTGYSDAVRCHLYQPNTGSRTCEGSELVETTGWAGIREYTTYELTGRLPQVPPPSRFVPSARGCLYRVWNACPRDNKFSEPCDSQYPYYNYFPFQALSSAFNPDYAAQTPMFEGVRADILKIPFGTYPDMEQDNKAEYQYAHDQTVPYWTLADASEDHGLAFEMMGFFVPPYTATYSFLLWGNMRSDLWMSRSEDVSDTVPVAEAFSTSCRQAQVTVLGCAMLEDSVLGDQDKEIGQLLSDSYGWSGDVPSAFADMRTPSIREMSLNKGERRYFVKRALHIEEKTSSGVRRRRRAWEGTGVRIHSPDLSGLSPAAREKLAMYKSWPEIIGFQREGSGSGTWRFSLDGTAYSRPIAAAFRDHELNWAWRDYVLDNGTRTDAECWYISSSGSTYKVMCFVWQPAGNLPTLALDRSSLGGSMTITVETISDGNMDDLFVFPIPGDFLEAPALETTAQLKTVGIPARNAAEDSKAVAVAPPALPVSSTPFDYANYVYDSSISSPTCSSPSPAFRYFRLTVLRTWSYEPGQVRLGEIHLWGAGGTEVDLSSATVAVNVAARSSEVIDNIIDGDPNTQFRGDDSSGTIAVITIDLGGGNDIVPEIWGFTTGSTRQSAPIQWFMEASSDQAMWRNISTMLDTYDYDTPSTSAIFKGAFPNELGMTACSVEDESGCGWGLDYQGTADSSNLNDAKLGDPQPYDNWRECKRRCCSDAYCQSAIFDSATGNCWKLARTFEIAYRTPGTGTYTLANRMSTSTPTDGYARAEALVDVEGLPLANYSGFQTLKSCKERCNANSLCRSFAWHETHGCFLKTQCVTNISRLAHFDDSDAIDAGFVTYYQTDPASCPQAPDDVDNETLATILRLDEQCAEVHHVRHDDSGSELENTELNSFAQGDYNGTLAECCARCTNNPECNFWQVNLDRSPPECQLRKGVSRVRTEIGRIAGFVKPLDFAWEGPEPPRIVSSVADSFIGKGTAENASLVSFAYLSASETPYVRVCLVGAGSGSQSFEFSEGDRVQVVGGNFGGVNSSNVKVFLGGTEFQVDSVEDELVVFTAPAATHGNVDMRILVDWKGWADFSGAGAQSQVSSASTPGVPQVEVVFGGGANEISSISPTSGSVLGGAMLKIQGKGFKMPAHDNVVLLKNTDGVEIGNCSIASGTLSMIECELPPRDRSGWTGVQTSEDIMIEVNSVSQDTQGASPTFTYSLEKTPEIQSVLPAAASFAITRQIILFGIRLSVLASRMSVWFGDRSCRVLTSNKTVVTCQLVRSSMEAATDFLVAPRVHVGGVGFADVGSVQLDTRFEIHSVSPAVGSEMGGAVVTITGVGFGSPEVTSQRMLAMLGTVADVTSWTRTEIVATTRAVTLNTDLVDVMVNLVHAKHMCGASGTEGPCIHAAFQADHTPEISALSPTTGRKDQTLQITVDLPTGSGSTIDTDGVVVYLGDYVCPISGSVAISGDQATIDCTIPEFEASTVPVQVLVPPLGYTKAASDAVGYYSQELVVDTITPNEGSVGGRKVVLQGAGFSSTPGRHFVRVGEESWGMCEPLASQYDQLECMVNFKKEDQDSGGEEQVDVEVMLWGMDMFTNPLNAFGGRNVGCMSRENIHHRWDVLSIEECAVWCLVRPDCVSFDYTPRRLACYLSDKSFTNCGSSCSSARDTSCVYYERLSEARPSIVVITTITNGFYYKRSLTPNIDYVFALPGQGADMSARDTDVVQTNDTGCGASHADLKDGNANCCADHTCSWGEGRCANSEQCGGMMQCLDRACSWSYTLVPEVESQRRRRRTHYEDRCCAVRGHAHAGLRKQNTFWQPGDEIVVRTKDIGLTDSANNFAGDAAVQAAIAAPENGYVNVSFGGVRCPVFEIRHIPERTDYIDVACTLGNVPGGLVHFPHMFIEPMGRVIETLEYLSTPLNITTVTVEGTTTPSLGGGWKLRVDGVGFATEATDAFVEVTLCGQKCAVTSASYTSVTCDAPAVVTEELVSGALPYTPVAKVVSRGAGLAKTSTPLCFIGSSKQEYEVGHPACVTMFDGDTELTTGFSGSNCHVGVDFGFHTNVRMEKLRFFPLYDVTEADIYVGGRFEVGVLDEAAHAVCNELDWGWRGDAYRGCQNSTSKGLECQPWSDADASLVEAFPELAGHNYCRNPSPFYRRHVWCYDMEGTVQECRPRPPEVTWTTVHSIASPPKMLWNTIEFSTPKTARFVRFASATGECRFIEMEVVGQLVAPSSQSCGVAVRNVRKHPGHGVHMDLNRPAFRGGGTMSSGYVEVFSAWSMGPEVVIAASSTPVISGIQPEKGTARGGTEVVLTGTNFGADWVDDGSGGTPPVSVKFNSYNCTVTKVNDTSITCITTPRNRGIQPPSTSVRVGMKGLAFVEPGVRFRYLDLWSDDRTWADREPPVDGDLVFVPDGQAVILDQNTPKLNSLIVEGIFVAEDSSDLEIHANYIWVKGGTFEVGTEMKPFLHKLTITLYGDKYEAIRLPVVGAKCLAVSNERFTIREAGDGAEEEGRVGTLDIHGAPRLKVWTRLAQTADEGSYEIVLQDDVDFVAGEELLITATTTPPKEMHGEGLHGAPPVHFENERVIVESLGSDAKTVRLRTPLHYRHISTSYTRPDGEYVDLSAEVAVLSRNVKIQGDESSESNAWGGHTLVAFGGVYRLENAEFYRMGQQGELSRYPIHFHVSREWGRFCYAKYNSIHHSFQRAVAIHSTEYTLVKGNVGFDIVGHMFFVETGMERFNVIEGNLGVGAIPLMSGMLESDQEPSGFWTAAPNNIWRDNVAVTGSDGWYFQLPDHPIAHNMDIYKDSVCPVGDRLGEWSGNRCHHVTGSCIRVYMKWKPFKIPCDPLSGENPQILFNTTCWGVGYMCFNAMFPGAIHNFHMTSVEVGLKKGGPDVFYMEYNKKKSHAGAKHPGDGTGIPFVKDSVFVGVLPENLDPSLLKWKATAIMMAQDEHFNLENNAFVNYFRVPCLMDCSKCWTTNFWKQGAYTHRTKGLTFINSSKRLYIQKKAIFHDLDGTLVGTPDSYTTWADNFNLIDHVDCNVTNALEGMEPNLTMAKAGTFDSGGIDMSDTMFHVLQHPMNLIHSRRNYSFITCRRPIRKLEVAYPEPPEVYLRQMNITNLDTGLTQPYEYEAYDIFGWTFPAVTGTRLEIQPNRVGLDLDQASVRWGYSDLFQMKADKAVADRQTVEPEWQQLVVGSTSSWDHYRVDTPDWELVGTRHGEDAGLKVVGSEFRVDYLTEPTPLQDPSLLPHLTHGMLDPQHWAVTFRFPDNRAKDKVPFEREPWTLRFDARRCPETGCTKGLPSLNQSWPNSTTWSTKFGDMTGQGVVIQAQDWVVFDVASLSIKNLTVFGKLSFDDSADRVLETDHIVVWGLLEIGTEANPFGATSGATATIRLRGAADDTDTYVYIEEQSLNNKLIAVVGRFEAYGAPQNKTWARLAETISSGATSACINVSEDVLDWVSGTEIAFAPTEFDRPAEDVETVTLTANPVWQSSDSCWLVQWSGGLTRGRFGGDVPIGNGRTVSLRAVVGRVDRSIIIESVDTADYYGGNIEIFDLPDLSPMRVGQVNLNYVRFTDLGKGGIDAAVRITYQSNFQPPPKNVFNGCSWTGSLWFALQAMTTNAPTIIKNNVMVDSHHGGIYTEVGATRVLIVNNAVIGVSLSPESPRMTNELTGFVRVSQIAGIRTDEMPQRMFNNVVAGSNDIGFLHRPEGCRGVTIFKNEAMATVVGVLLVSQKATKDGGACQAANLYTIWKAAHIGLFIADISVPLRLSHITVSDSHLGIVPYFTIKKDFRRLWVYDAVIMGSSPASSCSASAFCRAQHSEDIYMDNCNSIFAPANFRRVGFVIPFNTKNKKTCYHTMDERQCRMLSPAFPQLTCHYPWEYHHHFDAGMGWMFFERTTFAYFSSSDCNKISRAISVSPSAPEVSFPAKFTNTTWYETDDDAKFEMKAERLDATYVSRKKPCKYDNAGCMGLDQALLQDTDGTLVEGGASDGSVVPLTPRTENAWSPMCNTNMNGQALDAMVCPNVTVQIFEMRNLDRGADDVKFGPLVLTPSRGNGFEGGVLTSVGNFWGTCPCGWDFSPYHVLIKPNITYYAEVVSFPENILLRYRSESETDVVVLEYFYPASEGVNVFVGGSQDPDMSLKLARRPTLDDPHGAHLVDAQAKRLYITLRGGLESFNSQKDVVIRKTPSVKISMNVKMGLGEFVGANFQMNLAVLLGIPPERIKVVQVEMRRRLENEETTCTRFGCPNTQSSERRLQETTALEVIITPDGGVAAAASGGDQASVSADALNAQAAELNNVATTLGSLQTTDLAAAAGGEVEIEEIAAPAEVSEDVATESVSAEDVAPPPTVDVVGAAEALEAVEVSLNAACPADSSTSATVGGVTSSVSAGSQIESDATDTVLCSTVNAGYEGDITLTCSAGALSADSQQCIPLRCSAAVDVTVGGTTSSIAPSSPITSGLSSTVDCADVHPDYTGSVVFACLQGTINTDTSACMAGCSTASSVNVTVAGSFELWSPSSNMASGSQDTTACAPINSGYEGNVVISCFYGVLSVNPSACIAKSCAAGDTVSVTVGSTTDSVAIPRRISSGRTDSVSCDTVASGYSGDISLSCSMGSLTPDNAACKQVCATSLSHTMTWEGVSVTVSPASEMASGSTEYMRSCSDLHAEFGGTFMLMCDDGSIVPDLSSCSMMGCDVELSVDVTVAGSNAFISPYQQVQSGSTFDALCSDVNSVYDGVIVVTCAGGVLTADTAACIARPCATSDVVGVMLGSTEGLAQPAEEMADGSSGTVNCSSVSANYTGLISLTCSQGTLTADASSCRVPGSPTSEPTAPTPEPTESPTAPPPTDSPTPRPTVPPGTPTAEPTSSPTEAPTAPTDSPTGAPTPNPTPRPTVPPGTPTAAPTPSPTPAPTAPTDSPTGAPTESPTPRPTVPPGTPTAAPTTYAPTVAPTEAPTEVGQTRAPSLAPTPTPVAVPTPAPTVAPTPAPPAKLVVPMVIQGVQYSSLVQNETLKQDFISAIKSAVVAEAKGAINANHVEVKLSAGSVAAEVIITPPENVVTDDVLTTLSSSYSSDNLTTAITTNVQTVEGISAVTTGAIVTTVEAPRILTAAPTMAPTRSPTHPWTPAPTTPGWSTPPPTGRRPPNGSPLFPPGDEEISSGAVTLQLSVLFFSIVCLCVSSP